LPEELEEPLHMSSERVVSGAAHFSGRGEPPRQVVVNDFVGNLIRDHVPNNVGTSSAGVSAVRAW
jgi:hypothetical protein